MAEEVVIAMLHTLNIVIVITSSGIALGMMWELYDDWRKRKRIERIVRSMNDRDEEAREQGGE
jgi:hypothetical protein